MTARWFNLLPACPGCRRRLFALGLAGVLVATWPNPPWDALYCGGIAAMVLAPVALYPFSKLCWRAFDLLFRPPRPQDLVPPSAP